jgi:alanyl-tRNA synthetase
MDTSLIRKRFLDYFKSKQHAVISSSPVVPHEDPTLLFTNAGMNQFKEVFLGKSVRDYKRATTSQKCIRAGGKHNDLENVGHTKRHLTFFEMLGNFSFGDYFKKEAISFAWEVSTEVFGFDPNRIWPSVFRDDDEAFELWTKYVSPERIVRFGEKENFWAMGDTGPCGPCSELLYDRGPSYGNAVNPYQDTDGERFLEFWNLVFMQYNRQPSGINEPLPKPSIDTGAGLERVMSLIDDVDSVFETDVLRGLIAQVEQVSGKVYDPGDHHTSAAFRVIADHLRCLSFAIVDGAQPSNVDRGYVLRKILRRAVRYGRLLGFQEPFLHKVLPRLVSSMGNDYPEIKKGETRIAEILTIEEEAFIRTLKRGGNLLNQIMENAQKHGNKISGDDAFKLKDTYGFPIEEITLIAKDAGFVVDAERYDELEIEAKERSKRVHKGVQQVASENLFAEYLNQNGPSHFTGYNQGSTQAKITAIVKGDQFVSQISEGEEGMIILDQTPFYAEMGGQIGDTGSLKNKEAQFNVSDTQSPLKGVIGHLGKMERGSLSVGDILIASVDVERRQKIANNHTATHLLHWALHQVLGEHVKQAGSVVDSSRLRFDFSHHKALSTEEIQKIEDLVNGKIRENLPVRSYELGYEEAQKRTDIKQFFGEKYGSLVRVIDIDYSKELCGGTHTTAVGNIGFFKIAKEGSIAAGVRRIEAVTGKEAENLVRASDQELESLGVVLKVPTSKIKERLEKLLEENKELSQELKALKKQALKETVSSLVAKVENYKGLPVLIAELPVGAEDLRTSAEELINQLKSGFVALAATVAPDKCHLMIRVSDDWVSKGISAQEIIKIVGPIIEGSGGGRPNNAQAGGKAPNRLGEALSKIKELLKISLK